MSVITVKTMTAAQKAKRILAASGVVAEIVSLDKNLTGNGCAFGLSVDSGDAYTAKRLLDERAVPYGMVIGG